MSPAERCAACPAAPVGGVEKLGVDVAGWDFVVALAGNPNVGKSTVFNRLTGLRQHTGNWPGKTIARAEGGFAYQGRKYKLVDLPGTYSLRSASPDETVAREFILFGRPDVTLLVADASCLERNLNLVLQVLQITGRAVLCLNLMDEAEANGVEVDARKLSRELGIPVVPCAARSGRGLDLLLAELRAVATGAWPGKAHRLRLDVPGLEAARERVEGLLEAAFPGLANAEWVALRLLEGDRAVAELVEDGGIGRVIGGRETAPRENAGDAEAGRRIVGVARELRWGLPRNFNDRLTEAIYAESGRIAAGAVFRRGNSRRLEWQRRADRILTSPLTGFPVMGALFALVLWVTIEGANYPSRFLTWALLDELYPLLREGAFAALWPWLAGLLVDGIYLATAWVVSVMLPPMMVFFPAFTLLEDLGYLPRVAFNLDRIFQKAGAHGKQALTMAMGYGCNAAGVVAARVIDSPRERLIAVVTNNFAICNGRWPTQILMATIFLGALAPGGWAGAVATGAVFAVAALGFGLTLACSWLLGRTLLRGEASVFSLELPPYRPPNVARTLYTSLVDRTLFVLMRAVVFAAPAGALIWLVSHVPLGGESLAAWFVNAVDPAAAWFGLNGVVLLAYVIAVPANEIVIPTVLMLTTVMLAGGGPAGSGAGTLFDADGAAVRELLVRAGWTVKTAVCLMLFSLCHNPCSTTLWTIYKETRSAKWTAVSALLPLAAGFALCALVAAAWRMFG
ncbi:MAG: ferrous iron transport protein B [Opitutaceae bacterium]|jgi:ferrous iron transport protein B|nr:ferrous iron transport protein B [Opitutaceae bacterium]